MTKMEAEIFLLKNQIFFEIKLPLKPEIGHSRAVLLSNLICRICKQKILKSNIKYLEFANRKILKIKD